MEPALKCQSTLDLGVNKLRVDNSGRVPLAPPGIRKSERSGGHNLPLLASLQQAVARRHDPVSVYEGPKCSVQNKGVQLPSLDEPSAGTGRVSADKGQECSARDDLPTHLTKYNQADKRFTNTLPTEVVMLPAPDVPLAAKSRVLSVKGTTRVWEEEQWQSLPREPSKVLDRDISIRELSQYLHLPETAAATELRICATRLKQVCEGFGITRWPAYKSLDKQNAQAENGKGEDEEKLEARAEDLKRVETIAAFPLADKDAGGGAVEAVTRLPAYCKEGRSGRAAESNRCGQDMPHITKWEESWRKVTESGLVTVGGHLEYREQGETVIKIGELVKHSPDGQCPYLLTIKCVQCSVDDLVNKMYDDPAAFAVDAVELKIKGKKQHFSCTKVEDITVPSFRAASTARAGRSIRYRPPGSSTDFARLENLTPFFQQISKLTAGAASDGAVEAGASTPLLPSRQTSPRVSERTKAHLTRRPTESAGGERPNKKCRMEERQKMCSYAQCPAPLHSKKWHVINMDTCAGEQDWVPLVGQTLCDSCYSTFRIYGSFIRTVRTNDAKRTWQPTLLLEVDELPGKNGGYQTLEEPPVEGSSSKPNECMGVVEITEAAANPTKKAADVGGKQTLVKIHGHTDKRAEGDKEEAEKNAHATNYQDGSKIQRPIPEAAAGVAAGNSKSLALSSKPFVETLNSKSCVEQRISCPECAKLKKGIAACFGLGHLYMTLDGKVPRSCRECKFRNHGALACFNRGHMRNLRDMLGVGVPHCGNVVSTALVTEGDVGPIQTHASVLVGVDSAILTDRIGYEQGPAPKQAEDGARQLDTASALQGGSKEHTPLRPVVKRRVRDEERQQQLTPVGSSSYQHAPSLLMAQHPQMLPDGK